MRLIRQRNPLDCGLAIAATVVGTSWATAAAHDPDPNATRGLRLKELLALLETLTGQPWRVSRPHRPHPLYRHTSRQPVTILLLRRPGHPFGHWIALVSGRVYDPEERRALTVATYGRRRWLVWRIVLPA